MKAHTSGSRSCVVTFAILFIFGEEIDIEITFRLMVKAKTSQCVFAIQSFKGYHKPKYMFRALDEMQVSATRDSTE